LRRRLVFLCPLFCDMVCSERQLVASGYWLLANLKLMMVERALAAIGILQGDQVSRYPYRSAGSSGKGAVSLHGSGTFGIRFS
jgi:hypothetical protein